MDDILTPLATASPDSIHWAWKYWFVLWNTFDYQFCIVGHTNSSFRPDHAAIVASVPLRGIHHTKKSHKSSRVEHFYVLQRCIPYINTLGKETKIKTIITRIKKKKKYWRPILLLSSSPGGDERQKQKSECYFYKRDSETLLPSHVS